MAVAPTDTDVRLQASIADIPSAGWERLLPDVPDTRGYYLAVEKAPPPNFAFGAVSASDGDDLVAVAPTFTLDYRLDTSLQGPLHRTLAGLSERWPGLASAKVIAIGSPLLDNLTLGFAPSLGAFQRQQIFGSFLETMEAEAGRTRCQIIVAKSLDESQADLLHDTLTAHGYRRIRALPTVVVDLPFETFDAYLMSLSKKRRSNYRQKMRSLTGVRFERRSSVGGLEGDLYRLFEATRTRSRGQYNEFDKLHPHYFSELSAQLGERLQVLLFWKDAELVGMLTLLVGKTAIIARDFGMKYPLGRELNLYFLAFLETIRFAIDRRIATLDMGATTYETKLQFGGRLDRKWLYLKFRRPLANRLLGPLAPLFDFERNDPELVRLAAIETPPADRR
ncbi:MAG: GNAT family N-acetyltransferase [Hyphomicrobiaceae bacterium]|nr:GNAT family N-acetyltransferase [Hyphomicrobiaceae bacterium]